MARVSTESAQRDLDAEYLERDRLRVRTISSCARRRACVAFRGHETRNETTRSNALFEVAVRSTTAWHGRAAYGTKRRSSNPLTTGMIDVLVSETTPAVDEAEFFHANNCIRRSVACRSNRLSRSQSPGRGAPRSVDLRVSSLAATAGAITPERSTPTLVARCRGDDFGVINRLPGEGRRRGVVWRRGSFRDKSYRPQAIVSPRGDRTSAFPG